MCNTIPDGPDPYGSLSLEEQTYVSSLAKDIYARMSGKLPNTDVNEKHNNMQMNQAIDLAEMFLAKVKERGYNVSR